MAFSHIATHIVEMESPPRARSRAGHFDGRSWGDALRAPEFTIVDLEEPGMLVPRRYSRRAFLFSAARWGGGAALGGTLPLRWQTTLAAQTPAAQYLVLIVLDGFRPDYMTLAPMPALQALMRNGTTFDRAWVGQIESVTPASHASLATAVFPGRHGLIGFEWRDPKTKSIRVDGWDQGSTGSPVLSMLRTSPFVSLARAAKAQHPNATVVSISSEKPYAADAMGGPWADHVLSYGPGSDAWLQLRSTAGKALPPGFDDDTVGRLHLPLHHFSDWDYHSAELAVRSIQLLRPRLLFVNLPGADVYGHLYGGITGPDIMKRVVQGLDRNIGRIVAATKRAGIHDATMFAVVSDHGMTPNLHTVSPNAVNRAIAAAGAEQLFHTGGTASYIYLKEASRAPVVAHEVSRLGGVVTTYVLSTSSSVYQYVQTGGPRIDAGLDAAYRYLLGTIAGPAAPDVVAPFRENTVGKVVQTAYGHHGGLNWGAQHIPAVLSGPGIRSGTVSHFPARLVDLGATMYRVLGLDRPPTDGVVLADALASPSEAESAAQQRVAEALTKHVVALNAAFSADVARDKNDGVRSPPLRPARP